MAGLFSAERELSQLAAGGMTRDGSDNFDAGLSGDVLRAEPRLGIGTIRAPGATPETATGTGALPSQVPAGRPMAVCGGRTGQRVFAYQHCVEMKH